MLKFLKISILPLLLLALASRPAAAQFIEGEGGFRKDAFTQQYNQDSTSRRDTSDVLFSFKEYFGALGHKNEIGNGKLFGGSMVFLGGQQIYNKQYWKLPIIYGGIGAGIGLGIHYNKKWHSTGDPSFKKTRNWCIAGAALTYWGMLMDGTVNYHKGREDTHIRASKATVYSLLLPGLGQFYNGEYWKIPVYYTGLLFTASYIHHWNVNYHRYRRIYNEITDPDIEYTGRIQASTAQYYRNISRRYRDYFIAGFIAVYLLQVIDANVFAFMQNFDVDDNISFNMSPTVLPPGSYYASGGLSSPAFGMRIGLTF